MKDELKIVVDYAKLLGTKFGESTVIDFFRFLEEIPQMERVEENLYYEYKNRGISLLFRKNTLKTIFFYGENNEGFSKWDLYLPLNLEFDNTREDIIKKLGQPNSEGKAESILIPNEWEIWAKYNFSEFLLHLNFSTDENHIKMITIMSNEN